jgi:nucleolar protein 56
LQAFVVESLIGVFGFDESLNLLESGVFQRDPESLASNISRLQQGEIIDEVDNVVKHLVEKGFDGLILEDEELAKNVTKKYGVRVHVETPSAAGKSLRSRITAFSEEVGFTSKPEELFSLLHSVDLLLTKQKIRGAAERRDKLIVQAIEATEDPQLVCLKDQGMVWTILPRAKQNNREPSDLRYPREQDRAERGIHPR